ncbi:unnamed protein product [Caenorhabditis bovis]|uniref:NADAR domain-containing protein n=1 Tax=Caenorhabditis bovis TaxID=2654633 RepID=A0A8S1FD48_9PELO|nr:unnamed protein product [Caenorhabditis bovis]
MSAYDLAKELESLKLQIAEDKNRQSDAFLALKKEVEKTKLANAEVHNAVYLLQEEKTNLRKAVHKLKLRNDMMQRKINKLKSRIQSIQVDGDESSEDENEYLEYDDIGRNFYAIGGRNDPLAFGYSCKIKDEDGLEHESAERYYWYLMADYFKDTQAKEAIRTADSFDKAKNAKKMISGYDEKKWNSVKYAKYLQAQQRKFDQLRSLRNILVLTDKVYLAVCQDDKYFGTGWRKQREEAMKPLTWDGENNGGKVLMKLRKGYIKSQKWTDENEIMDAEQRMRDLKRFTWRRVNAEKNPSSGRARQQRSKA